MASSWQRVLGGVRTVFSRFTGSKAAEVSACSIKIRKCIAKLGNCLYEVRKTNILINAHPANICFVYPIAG